MLTPSASDRSEVNIWQAKVRNNAQEITQKE